MDWNAVSAISSLVATVSVIIALAIALRQLRESSIGRKGQSALALIGDLQSSQVRLIRDELLVHSNRLNKLAESCTDLGEVDSYLRANLRGLDKSEVTLVEVRRAMASLEFIAVLCLHNSMPIQFERAYLGPTLLRYWQSFRPVVMIVRRSRGDAIYLQHLEAVVGLIASGMLFSPGHRRHKRNAVARIVGQSRAGAIRRAGLALGGYGAVKSDPPILEAPFREKEVGSL
ncbi:hypothetical protein EDC02_6041 [Micromonospora sp. Llam0]|uniref:DUF4760 domain-containing protein n=1 Tax=Micromonospora sp. Llam0 TaxID=2485143 RepID=UPI000FA15731|nr:hypothetical protein [Micromonospora sp. Llam0]ROO51173.1 hypothetical protein EDC02_6041 [Micromonospora sp. Llam0]